ncbi:MAG TPA: serine/threonine-protein kinase [Planctomycetota bacterium]|jgi:serine/threonine-protein kinase|nr:serine/threonine-protein kinase [Planctomycetota bacterium]
MTGAPAGGSKDDYSFGQVAIRENFCTFEQVKECLDIQTKLRGLGIEPKKLGEILIEKGYLTPEQAVQIVKLQAQSTASVKFSIPGYELLSKIGQGAMGTVYKARQVSMDRIVAIKILSPRYSKDRSFVERFVREARAVAKLNHENIILGIDVGEAGGVHYFVMEYVDGVPLSSVLKREGRLDEKRCLTIGLQIARALSHAHKHGIVHRDIKPENIMIASSGLAKLCDLGLAKQTKGDAGVTMDGTSVGTPNYISPEQARGEENIDTRSDIYSLGASLYHMATGSPPFSGSNPMVVMTKHVTEFPEPPRKRNPALSEAFSALILRMMQKRREDRPQDPDALIAEMERVLAGQAPVPAPSAERRPISVVQRPALERRHPTTHHRVSRLQGPASRTPAVVAAVALAALAAVFFIFLGGGDAEPPPASAAARPAPPAKAPPPPPPPAADPADRLRKDLEAFRELAEAQMRRDDPERFTGPYRTILEQIERARKNSDFAAQKAWLEEQTRFEEKVNQAILQTEWLPRKKRVDEHFAAGRYAQALTELQALDEVYKWLARGPASRKTKAGEECDEYLERVRRSLEESTLSGLERVERLFADPAQRREAYRQLDALVVSAPPAQKEDLEARRRDLFRRELGEILGSSPTPDRIRKAQERLAELRAAHKENPAAIAALAEEGARISGQAGRSVADLSAQAAAARAQFRGPFEEALRKRDLPAARRLLHALLGSREAEPLAALLLPAAVDRALAQAFADPARTAPVDARRLVQSIEAALAAGAPPGPARETALDLRTAALLEDLLEQALEGARAASRDANRFKTGFSSALKDAVSAEPAPRKPGEPPALLVTVAGGAARTAVPLTPVAGRSGPVLTEEDVVALARRAPQAAGDDHFALKACLFFFFAGKLPQARDWFDQVPAPQRVGLERLAEALKDVPSGREEETARALYEEAYGLFRKKDEIGAARKFRECVEKYGHTEYMKKPSPVLGKSRLEIVEELFPTPGRPRGVRPELRRLFAASEVKEVGRNRVEVVYTFKDDRELSLFSVGEGVVTATRVPGGVQLSGLGMWYWAPPLKGNVTIEATFRIQQEGSFGLLVHGEGGRAGYMGVVDLPLGQGQGPLDAIFKLPVGEGAQAFNAILAQGGRGELSLVRGSGSNQASFAREGTRLRLSMARGVLETDHAQFSEGRAGCAPLFGTVILERLRIVGEVDGAWLDAELKKLESVGK